MGINGIVDSTGNSQLGYSGFEVSLTLDGKWFYCHVMFDCGLTDFCMLVTGCLSHNKTNPVYREPKRDHAIAREHHCQCLRLRSPSLYFTQHPFYVDESKKLPRFTNLNKTV